MTQCAQQNQGEGTTPMNMDNIAFILCIFFLYVFGFYTCRQCSIFFDEAKCGKSIKIKNALWRELLISPSRKSFKNGRMVQPDIYNQSRMSLVGFVAHLIINFGGIFLLIITVQQKAFQLQPALPVEAVTSLLVVFIVAFQVIDVFNNRAI